MKRLAVILSAFWLTCSCGGGGGGSSPSTALPIVVTLAPANQTAIDQGQTLNFTATLVNDTGGQGVSWSVTGSGCTGTTCGTFTNITKTTATYVAPEPVSSTLTVSVIATSVAQAAVTSSSTVMVSPVPTIMTTPLPTGTPNQPYNATLSASGGAGILSWSLAGGTVLPAGLTMNNAGVIYGTPTASGITTFTAKVTDSSGASAGPVSAQQQFKITVVGVLGITTLSLPNGAVGVTYGASVQASGGALPIIWSVYSGALPPGLALQGTHTNAGMVTGTPTSAGTYAFTIEAEDSSNPAQLQYQALEITINPAGPLTITTTSLLDGTSDVSYSAQLVATGGTPPIGWSLTAGALPTGLALNPLTGAISGTATSPGTSSFTVTATDATSAHVTQPLSITINAPPAACSSSGNNGALNGQYAFSLSGYNGRGFLAVVGSLTADGNGHITAGEADTNGVLGAQEGSLITTGSSYSVGPDNRGCATIATTFGTLITRFALGSTPSGVATNGQIIEFDTPNPSAFIATGQILQQSPAAFANVLSGTFVFRTIGWDPSAPGRDVCVGAVVAVSLTLSNLDEECNDAGTASNPTGGTGTYTTFDSNGRFTATVLVGTGTFQFTYYLVSNSQFLIVNADSAPTVSGFAQQQNMPAGGFNANSLNGNLVFYLNGLSGGGSGADASIDLASANGASSLKVASYENYLGVWQGTPPPIALTCNYTVGSNGRVTLRSPSSSSSCGVNPPIIYLTAPNAGFMVDTAAGVDTGSLALQTDSPFTNASLSGTFNTGLAEVVSQDIGSISVGNLTLNGSGHVSGTIDLTSTSNQISDNPITDTYAVNSNGTFSFGSTGATIVGLVISNSHFEMFEPSSTTTSFPILWLGSK